MDHVADPQDRSLFLQRSAYFGGPETEATTISVDLRAPLAPTEAANHDFVSTEIAKLQEGLALLATTAYQCLLTDIATEVADVLRAGGKAMFCGNGGSAADAQHLAAELVGRQNFDRPAAAALALTVDTSALTAVANDYGYEQVFARQVEAVGRPGDVLVAISTSGRSASVVRAVDAARARGIKTVAMTGRYPRDLAAADLVLAVPAAETAKIQEMHIVSGHIISGLVERMVFGPTGP